MRSDEFYLAEYARRKKQIPADSKAEVGEIDLFVELFITDGKATYTYPFKMEFKDHRNVEFTVDYYRHGLTTGLNRDIYSYHKMYRILNLILANGFDIVWESTYANYFCHAKGAVRQYCLHNIVMGTSTCTINGVQVEVTSYTGKFTSCDCNYLQRFPDMNVWFAYLE
jgi:hypothetical protein